MPSWNLPWYSDVHAEGLSALCTTRLSTSVYLGDRDDGGVGKAQVSRPHEVRVLVLERRRPELGGPLVAPLDVVGGNTALADPTAIELYGEAQMVADDVDDPPWAGIVVVGQLGVMAVPVERGARLFH